VNVPRILGAAVAVLVGLVVVVAAGSRASGDSGTQRVAAEARLSAPATLTPPTEDGRSNEAATAEQQAADRSAVRHEQPCGLVSARQAATILGGAVEKPLQAVQGPTCVYRTRDGEAFVTLSVQTGSLPALRARLAQRTRVEVGGRAAYCGTYGQPMLAAAVAGGYVLNVAGPCDVAKRFAGKALAELAG
jgi:hypothetical protein